MISQQFPGNFDRRLALNFGAVVLVLIMTATGAATFLFSRLEAREEDRLASAMAVIIAESVSRVSFSGKHHARLLVEEMRARVTELYDISVETSDGLILAHSDRDRNDAFVTPEELERQNETLRSGLPCVHERTTKDGEVKEVLVPYRGGFNNQVLGVVRVGVKVNEAREIKRVNTAMLLVLNAGLTLAGIIIVYLLSRRFGRDMRNLAMQLKGILDHAPLGIAISARDGRILARSKSLEDGFGLPASTDLAWSYMSRSLSGESSSELLKMDDLVLLQGEKVEREVFQTVGDSRKVWQIVKFPISRSNDGKVDQMCSVLLDISDQKEAMEQLRRSEERFSKLFRYSPEAILLIDMETTHIKDANEAFCTLTGYGLEELIGRTALEISFYVDPSNPAASCKLLAENGHCENLEFEGRCKEGTTFIGSISGQQIEINGGVWLICMIRDVTELKKMQEMMIQTEKMISIGGIAAGIAHEINNPLGIVLQAAQNLVLRTRIDFQKNRIAAEKIGVTMESISQYMQERKLDVFIQDIQSAALRASGIIRHMLDFSRRSESRVKICNLYEIIDKAVDLANSDYDLKKSYDFKRIKIVREYEDGLPEFNCTETEIEQVILNLLRNSAQALSMADPPVPDPAINIRVTSQKQYVMIELSDNGPGIPEHVQKRIFEPFYTTKPSGVGTGLGLSVSYFIITKGHGGKMTVRSKLGEGASFILELPVSGA